MEKIWQVCFMNSDTLFYCLLSHTEIFLFYTTTGNFKVAEARLNKEYNFEVTGAEQQGSDIRSWSGLSGLALSWLKQPLCFKVSEHSFHFLLALSSLHGGPIRVQRGVQNRP